MDGTRSGRYPNHRMLAKGGGVVRIRLHPLPPFGT